MTEKPVFNIKDCRMKRVIFNQKGGVGKTSITCNLAASIANSGKRVLVIDLDSQANSSQYLLGDTFKGGPTIGDFFSSTLKLKLYRETLKEAAHKSPYPNLYVIPADPSLGELLPKLESRYKIFKLGQAIDSLVQEMKIDEVFLDTPPALNFYSMSALISADRVLIPFDCDAFSAKALIQVMETVEEVAEDHQPNLTVEGVIINHFQAQAKLPIETIEALMAKGFKILSPYLSSSVVVRESHSLSKPLIYYKPNHKLTLEFDALAKQLMPTKGGKLNRRPVASKGDSTRYSAR
jgi:chromosome partitioning protein